MLLLLFPSVLLVMVPTPVPPTRQGAINARPAPCPAQPPVHWAGPVPVLQMPPPLPLHHPLLYSSGYQSLLIQPKVIKSSTMLLIHSLQFKYTPHIGILKYTPHIVYYTIEHFSVCMINTLKTHTAVNL